VSINEKVHYYAFDLIVGNREKFEGSCRTLADFYVKRCAFENTVRNCDANDVRYARVPTGSETCPWCLMLASRGFVYHSEAFAEHGKHKGCDCIVLPGKDGVTQIDGYDPDELYARWAGTGFKGAGSGSTYTRAKRYEPTMDAGDSMKLQRKLLRGLSKADRDTAMDIILDANEEWSKNRHDVEVHNHFAKRVQSAMMDNHITNSDLAERARTRRVSGAVSGAYNDENDPSGAKRDAHARRFYEEIRKRNVDVECQRISKNTGIGEAVVRQAYDHVFVNEHDLDGDHKRVDPDYEMSQTWQRLSTGTMIRSYDSTLIFHEAIESEYMAQGVPYNEAHSSTCRMGYDWFHDMQSWKHQQMMGGE